MSGRCICGEESKRKSNNFSTKFYSSVNNTKQNHIDDLGKNHKNENVVGNFSIKKLEPQDRRRGNPLKCFSTLDCAAKDIRQINDFDREPGRSERIKRTSRHYSSEYFPTPNCFKVSYQKQLEQIKNKNDYSDENVIFNQADRNSEPLNREDNIKSELNDLRADNLTLIERTKRSSFSKYFALERHCDNRKPVTDRRNIINYQPSVTNKKPQTAPTDAVLGSPAAFKIIDDWRNPNSASTSNRHFTTRFYPSWKQNAPKIKNCSSAAEATSRNNNNNSASGCAPEKNNNSEPQSISRHREVRDSKQFNTNSKSKTYRFISRSLILYDENDPRQFVKSNCFQTNNQAVSISPNYKK